MLGWVGTASAQVQPAPPSQPNMGYASVICSRGTARYVEANIWTGVSKTDPTNVRFVTECLPCAVPAGCQEQSVATTLDWTHYTWKRINAGCFTPALPSENVSIDQVTPRSFHVHEDQGGCAE